MTNFDMRKIVAASVGHALKETYPESTIEHTATTSDCPMIRFTIGATTYNLTITRERK